MKSGSASIERQAETQAPHWMQAIDWVTSIIDSGGTMYSRSGGSPSGSSQGVTRRILVQWVDSMSVTRSLITGMFPIGSTTIGLAVAVRLPAGWRVVSAKDWASSSIVLQASAGLAVDLHPAGAADRGAAGAADGQRAVVAVLRLQQPVEDGERGVELDVEGLPVGALALLGLEAPHLERELSHPHHPTHLVGPLLRLPLGDRHLGVADLGAVVGAGQVDVLEPLLVVPLGEVGAELGAAALGAVDRARRRCTPRSRACSRARARRARPG